MSFESFSVGGVLGIKFLQALLYVMREPVGRVAIETKLVTIRKTSMTMGI